MRLTTCTYCVCLKHTKETHRILTRSMPERRKPHFDLVLPLRISAHSSVPSACEVHAQYNKHWAFQLRFSRYRECKQPHINVEAAVLHARIVLGCTCPHQSYMLYHYVFLLLFTIKRPVQTDPQNVSLSMPASWQIKGARPY